MHTVIGVLSDGTLVRVSPKTVNGHVAILGISGSGKSTRMREIIKEHLKQKETLIFMDLEGEKTNFPEEAVNLIDLQEKGFNLSFLDTKNVDEGKESYVSFIAYITELLAGTQNLGVKQLGILREAIEYAVEHRDEHTSELEAIADGLKLLDSTSASGVYNRLWSILESRALRSDGMTLQKEKINIISLAKMATSAQKSLVEIILGIFWRNIRLEGPKDNKITIVLDEFQRLRLNEKSVLMELFTQGRKYGIKVIVTTQSEAFVSKDVRNAIDQAATKLIFKPASKEVKRIAETIDSNRPEEYILRLKKLKVGECIAVGKFEFAGKEVDVPINTKTNLEMAVISSDKAEDIVSL